MASVETTWTLTTDKTTGQSTLRITYHSQLPPAMHEKIHRELVELAKKALGLRPDLQAVRVVIEASAELRTHDPVLVQPVFEPGQENR